MCSSCNAVVISESYFVLCSEESFELGKWEVLRQACVMRVVKMAMRSKFALVMCHLFRYHILPYIEEYHDGLKHTETLTSYETANVATCHQRLKVLFLFL